jgi:cell wall-associated NlpC family hydrolase
MSRTQTLLLSALVTLSSACAAHSRPGGPAPQPFPRPGADAAPTPASRTSEESPPLDGYAIAGTALSLRGTPYRNGGSDPSGFDCSGFVWFVFAQHGIVVPRTVSDQARLGDRIPAAALNPGDLVFFNTKGVGPTHVGIAIGGDGFVHAPSSSGEVRVERIGSRYWSPRLVDARRITPRGAVPCASDGVHSCQ